MEVSGKPIGPVFLDLPGLEPEVSRKPMEPVFLYLPGLEVSGNNMEPVFLDLPGYHGILNIAQKLTYFGSIQE